MGGLLQLLGIERGTDAKGDAGAEEDVVGDSGDTTVVDLALFVVEFCQCPFSPTSHFSHSSGGRTNLGEGSSIETVLGGDLEADSAARGLGVPRGLGTSLNQGVDLVVVRGGENAALVGGSDGGSPGGLGEADGGGKGGDAGLLDVVASGSTGEETLVANNGVNVGGGALEQVGESTEVELGLLEVDVDLGAGLLALGQEGEGTLELQALGDVVGGLDLGLERVQGVPSLGDGEA